MIPEDWEVVELEQLVEPSRSIRYGIVQPGGYDRSGCLMVRSQDYSRGWVDEANMHRVGREIERQYNNAKVKRSDLILTIVGAGIGQVAEVPCWLSGAVLSRSTGRISLSRDVCSSGYGKACLQSGFAKKQILDAQKEGAQPVISCKDLSRLKLPYPSLQEQEAIATALSDVDALIESLEQLIVKKRNIKQGAMQELLTGKRRLPGFSGEWEVKRLGDLGRCHRGVSYNPIADLSIFDKSSTIRLLRSNNVQEAKVIFLDMQYVDSKRVSSDQILRTKDVLICMANGSRDLVGKAGQFLNSDGLKYTFGAFMACFRPDVSITDSDFVFNLFQTSKYRDHISIILAGSSINNLKPSSVEDFQVFIPTSKDEQTAIGSALSDMDTEITALDAKLSKFIQHKRGMMQELLTGRIRLV